MKDAPYENLVGCYDKSHLRHKLFPISSRPSAIQTFTRFLIALLGIHRISKNRANSEKMTLFYQGVLKSINSHTYVHTHLYIYIYPLSTEISLQLNKFCFPELYLKPQLIRYTQFEYSAELILDEF